MKKKILYFFSMLFILLIVLRASYAYYIKSYGQENSNIVKTKCLNLSITNEKNDIKLDEQYPIPDSEGKKLTPYQFTITNTCEQFISYNVNLEALEGTTMNSNAIKVMVNNEAPANLATLDTTQTSINNSVESRILVTGSLGSGDSVDYAVRLWMDYGDSVDLSSMNKVFNSKVVVTATIGTYKPSNYVATLHDAILINEYGVTDVDNAISRIEAKGVPDFSKTAPIITWQENQEDNTTYKNVTTMSPNSVNIDTKTENLTTDDTLLKIYKEKSFDSARGIYTLSNSSFADPTILDYSSNEHYYIIQQYATTDSKTQKIHTEVVSSNSIIYEIVGATKKNNTSIFSGTTYDTIYYTLTVKILNGKETESDKSDKGLYCFQENNSKTYYYRGDVLNNNVYFAGYYWKIISINNDNTIKVLYNGQEKNATGSSQTIGPGAYNTLTDNPAYVGYMYGSDFTSKENANKNEIDSTVKEKLDSWYVENIENKNLNFFVADSGFCNDRRLQYGTGYTADSNSSYIGYTRNYTNKKPSLTCEKNDLFTLKSASLGNNALSYPIGLITADELVLSGNSSNYLNKLAYTYSSESYFSMTPEGYSASYEMANVIGLFSEGKISHMDTFRNYYYIRPVINLKSDVKISGGIGTVNDPYVVDTNN